MTKPTITASASRRTHSGQPEAGGYWRTDCGRLIPARSSAREIVSDPSCPECLARQTSIGLMGDDPFGEGGGE